MSHQIIEGLLPLATPIGPLSEDPANARKHSQRNLDAIKGSLKRYGQRKPIVVNRRDGTIEAGNGTFVAAKALGWDMIAAVFVDDDATTATGYAIADNRTAELAEWDDQALAALLGSVVGEIPEDALGFTEAEVTAMLVLEAGWGEALDGLPEADAATGRLRKVSFMLTEDQNSVLEDAIQRARSHPRFVLDPDNQNRNGCALAFVAASFK